MFRVLINRFIFMCLTLAAVSVVAFVLIQLPPGDFADAYANKKQATGAPVSNEELIEIRRRLGLDRPWHIQYFSWVAKIVFKGDMGYSFEWRRPVVDVIGERLPFTLILAFSTLFFMYALAIPIGIYSAVRQYSISDHVFAVVGYLGLATPNFMLALILMYIGQKYFGQSVGGLLSPEFQDVPWSWGKVVNLAEHLWVPVIVLGTSGTAYLIRTLRASVLDELNKMYVVAARAGGLSPMHLLLKYPVRIALNPIAATLGWRISAVISGAPIVGVVMSLPDTGPLFLQALLNQDMALAGAMVLIFAALTIVGTFISDILLVFLDPRIRMEN